MTGAMQSMLGLGKVVAGAASVSISPTFIDANPAAGASYSGNATATPTGITSPTYAWSWLSGGAGLTLSSTSTATVSITASAQANGTNFSGELQCVVSGTGGPKSADIPVNVVWGTGV